MAFGFLMQILVQIKRLFTLSTIFYQSPIK